MKAVFSSQEIVELVILGLQHKKSPIRIKGIKPDTMEPVWGTDDEDQPVLTMNTRQDATVVRRKKTKK